VKIIFINLLFLCILFISGCTKTNPVTQISDGWKRGYDRGKRWGENIFGKPSYQTTSSDNQNIYNAVQESQRQTNALQQRDDYMRTFYQQQAAQQQYQNNINAANAIQQQQTQIYFNR